MMRFDLTKRASLSMLFRHTTASAETSLHSFKNEAIFDTKYSKTCHASYFIHLKDFLDKLMDMLTVDSKYPEGKMDIILL